ncbi:hypothetical protein [Nonomuraea rubra]|uniref:hypothetical protein n=1 Tax=Nonomuraea rubra TaxID=46180 RepID=UPI0031E53628
MNTTPPPSRRAVLQEAALRRAVQRGAVLRRAVAVPLAATTLIGVLGAVPAHATSDRQPAASRIPGGFLLYEGKAARQKAAERLGRATWTTTDRRDVPFLVDPCATKQSTDPGRRAARTITGDSVEWDDTHSEQLIVYRDASAARAAVQGLRAQLRRCAARDAGGGHTFIHATRPARIGDEAFLVKGFFVASGMAGTVARQGRAIVIYTFSDHPEGWPESKFGGKQARAMIAKLARSPLGSRGPA